MSMLDRRFSGMKRLYGEELYKSLSDRKIAIAGLGGVGSWIAESMARSGVGNISLFDLDDLCETNINRQVHATTETIGHLKVDALKHRLLLINPELKIETHQAYLSPKNFDLLLNQDFDYIIDATDDFSLKCQLLVLAKDHPIKVFMIGAAGGKKDPAQIKVDDITQATNDKLLASVRKKLRQDMGFPRGKSAWNIKCVFSNERAVYPSADGLICHSAPGRAIHQDCETGFGSATHVTGSFAFFCVAEILKEWSTNSDKIYPEN
jgi:tRNA A37 threonylcarbamoyladenosine dehydratase